MILPQKEALWWVPLFDYPKVDLNQGVPLVGNPPLPCGSQKVEPCPLSGFHVARSSNVVQGPAFSAPRRTSRRKPWARCAPGAACAGRPWCATSRCRNGARGSWPLWRTSKRRTWKLPPEFAPFLIICFWLFWVPFVFSTNQAKKRFFFFFLLGS